MNRPSDPDLTRETNRGRLFATVVLATILSTAPARAGDAAPPEEVRVCPGDCNENGEVHISELISLVRIASELQGVTSCSTGDFNGDGLVRVNEIVRSVGSGLHGCPSQRVDEIVAKWAPAGDPGGVVMIVDRDRVLHRAAYGLADVAAGIANTTETLFLNASISKAFAGLAAMSLVEDGLLAYDDPVASYLPEIAHLGDELRIRHLLQSNGGLPDYFDPAVFLALTGLSPAGLLCVLESLGVCPSQLGECLRDSMPFTPERLLDLLTTWESGLEFTPSTSWRYNNPGFELLTLVIERVTGESYESFVDERVFAPAGMSHSVAGLDARAVDNPHLASGHALATCKDGSAGWQSYDTMLPDLPGSVTTFSTVDDLHALDRAIRAGTIVRRETLEHSIANAVQSDEPGLSYAFGMIVGEVAGEPMLQIAGSFFGYNTIVLSLTERRLTVIVLLNREDLTDGYWQSEIDLLRPIVDIYLGD